MDHRTGVGASLGYRTDIYGQKIPYENINSINYTVANSGTMEVYIVLLRNTPEGKRRSCTAYRSLMLCTRTP